MFVHVPRSLNGPARDKTAKLGALFMGPIRGKKINHATYMRSLGLEGEGCLLVSGYPCKSVLVRRVFTELRFRA